VPAKRNLKGNILNHHSKTRDKDKEILREKMAFGSSMHSFIKFEISKIMG